MRNPGNPMSWQVIVQSAPSVKAPTTWQGISAEKLLLLNSLVSIRDPGKRALEHDHTLYFINNVKALSVDLARP